MAIVPDFEFDEEKMQAMLEDVSNGKHTPEEAVKELSRIVASLVHHIGKLDRRTATMRNG